MTTELREKLFSVIRSGLELNNPSIQIANKDYNDLLQIAKQQSIQPIIYRGLKNLGAPIEVVSNFDKARLKDTRQYVLQYDALNKISDALNDVRIPHVPLKGAVLRQLYPAPELRTSVDIDVLVHEADLERALKAIEATTDFKTRKRNYHDVSMVNPSVHLELHFSIKENMDNIDKLLDQVWDYAVSANGYRYSLIPEFQVFHVIAHMSYHMVHGGLGIRPFLDLWLLRNKTFYNEETVRQMCSDCSILIFYEKSCKLVDSWMTGRPVSEDLKALENYALNGGVFGSKKTALASKQRKHRGISYFFNRVFISRDLLAIDYPKLKEKPCLLPIYQIIRWLKILNRQKRKQVRGEIRRLSSMNQQEIDSFDMLLKSLGL